MMVGRAWNEIDGDPDLATRRPPLSLEWNDARGCYESQWFTVSADAFDDAVRVTTADFMENGMEREEAHTMARYINRTSLTWNGYVNQGRYPGHLTLQPGHPWANVDA